MRQFKFRAWDNHDKKLINIGDALSSHVGLECMQYTGLKDKNGKEIYEGDILQFPWDEEGNIHSRDTRELVEWSGQSYNPYKMTDGEVIGNIYENPELMK